jgi:thiol-disulfide isomerase/thioredoxin
MAHEFGSNMDRLSRRVLLAAGGTLAAGLVSRKPHAAELPSLSAVLKLVDPPAKPPPISFRAADGTEHALSAFLGHGMVVNLWATWCAPCVAELPALSALSARLAPKDIAVLPLSSDRGGAATVQAFFRAHGITGLPVLLDPRGAAAEALNAPGIPTTVLIDVRGMERARLAGAADWSTPEAVALVERLVA